MTTVWNGGGSIELRHIERDAFTLCTWCMIFFISSPFEITILPVATGASCLSYHAYLVCPFLPCRVEFNNVLCVVLWHLRKKGLWLCRRRSDVTRTFTTRCSQLFSLVLKKKEIRAVVSLMRYDVPENIHMCNKN